MTLGELIHTKQYEHIEMLLRRHWVTFVPYIILFLILGGLPLIAYYFFANAFASLVIGPVAHPLIVLSSSAYYLCIFLFAYSFFVGRYLDLWIVTNDRLVDIRQISLFGRTVAEVDLYQIQDVASQQNGLFASVFNYGDIYLQTAGPIPKFIMYNIPNPEQVRQRMIELSSEDKKFHSGQV